MSFYVVTYDLRKKDEFDYEKLWSEFKRLDTVKCQESVYLLSTSSTLSEVKVHFESLVHGDDLLMVVKFSEKPEWTKGLTGTNAWIKKNWP